MYAVSGPHMTAVAIEKKKVTLFPSTKKCEMERDHASKRYSHVVFAPHRPLMALGSVDGSIQVIDTRTGKVSNRFSLHGPLAGLGFASSSLFAARADCGEVVEWDLDSEEEKSRFVADADGLNCLCVSTDESDEPLVATARTGITVWSQSKKVSKYSGHTSPVTCMAFLKGGALVTGTAQDRFLSVWPANTKKARHPILTLTCPEPAKWISCGASLIEGDEAAILSLSLSGEKAYIWRLPPVVHEENMPPRPFNASISVADKETLLGCDFSRNGSSVFCLALGPQTLDPVTVEAPILSATSEGGLITNVSVSTSSTAGAVNGGGASVAESKSSSSESMNGDAKSSSKLKRLERSAVTANTTASENGASNEAKRIRGVSNASAGEDERPLMARLLEYSGRLDVSTFGEADAVASSSSRVTAPSSLSVALEQALQTEDKDKIEAVLQTGDTDIISQTVYRLSSNKVAPLIRELAVRMQGKPGRASNLLIWINAIMEHHAALLTTDAVARESLRSMYAVADARVQTFDKLLRLKGRLELILAKSNIGNSAGTTAKQSSGPLVVVDGTKD